MQHPDDEQDSSDAGEPILDLARADRVTPVRWWIELRREEDVRGEDQVVGDVGQHDEALARAGVRPEDLCGVALPEAFDEGPEQHRDAYEQRCHEYFEDPPVHDPFSVSTVGHEQEHGSEHRGTRGGGSGDTRPPPAAPAIIGDAALHPSEQIGSGLDLGGARVERVAEAVFEPAHRLPSSRCSRAARPRWRWVLTEFGERPRVSAISGMPRSSR